MSVWGISVTTIMTLNERAYKLATLAHKGQYRRNGEEYICHCERVVQMLMSLWIKDEVILATAWLHDTLEDTSISIAEINNISKDVANNVLALSRKEWQLYQDYIESIKEKDIRMVKICDIVDNLNWQTTRKQRQRYTQALFYFSNLI